MHLKFESTVGDFLVFFVTVHMDISIFTRFVLG